MNVVVVVGASGVFSTLASMSGRVVISPGGVGSVLPCRSSGDAVGFL